MARGRGAQVKFQNHLPNLLSLLPKEIESRLQVAATAVEGEVRETLSGSRSGKRYPVYPRSKTMYTASAPFQPPAVRSGELRRKYKGFVQGKGLYAEGIVASPTIYSKWLEFGTSKMAARPHLRKSAYKKLNEIADGFEGFFE
jgi:hypothetical protein